MPFYQIKDLGAVGVIADIAPTDLPPNGFTDAINARFINGRVVKFGGNKPVSFQDQDKSLVPLSILPVPFDNFERDLPFNIVGTTDSLYKISDTRFELLNNWVLSGTPYTATKTVKVYPVLTDVSFPSSSATVKAGQSIQLSVSATPANARNASVTWTVSNKSFGTLDVDPNDGFLATFHAGTTLGNVTISVTSTDGLHSDYVALSIVENLDSISLSTENLSLSPTVSHTLQATLRPSVANPDLIWVSTDDNIVSVTRDPNDHTKATVTAKRIGSAIISTYLSTAPNKKASCTVTVKSGVDYITISHYSQQIEVGKSFDLDVTVVPTTAPIKKIDWSIIVGSNIISYTTTGTDQLKCTIHGDKVGVATIRATAHDGGNSIAECKVTVVAASTKPTPGGPIPRLKLAAPFAITSVDINAPVTDLDVGQSTTFKAVINPTPPAGTQLIYQWSVNRDGIVIRGFPNDPTFDIAGRKEGTVTVTLEVWEAVQTHYRVSPENGWWHTIVANCAVANTNNYQPLVKEFADEYFKPLPGWGDQTKVNDDGDWYVNTYPWRCERIRAFNNRLFALNMRETNESGVEVHYPLRLRWSNFATENKAPTLWDDLADLRDPEDGDGAQGTLKALINGYAGYIDLADSNGNLLDMLPLKDYLFVYTEFETYVGTPTMNAYQPMTFKKLFNDSGLLAPGCVVETEMGHFVVTQNDVLLHNGASKKSLAASRVRNKIISEINAIKPQATRVHLHQDKNEVWILYVGPNQPKNAFYLTKAAVWNFEFDTWTFCEIPFAYAIALTEAPSLDKSAQWSDYSPTGKKPMKWSDLDAGKKPWQTNFYNFRKRITIVGSAMEGFYQVDEGAMSVKWVADLNDATKFNVIEEPLKMEVTRTGIDFDNMTQDWNQKHVNRFSPQVVGTGTLTFVAGGTQHSHEFGHSHSTKTFTAGVDRHVNVRLNHPYLFYKIIDEDVDSKAGINSLTIDFKPGGRR